jgi:hypothetical protein
VLVVFAPVLYNFIRRKKPAVSKDDPSVIMEEPQVQGYVYTLLAASTLILAALLGQLLVAALLIIQVEAAMALVAKGLLLVVIGISAVYVLLYTWSSIRFTLEEKAKKMERVAQVKGDRQHKLNQKQLKDLPQEAEAYYTHERNLSML